MSAREFDKKITETLIINSDKSVKMKDMVWSGIQKELENKRGASLHMLHRKRRKKPFILGIASVAAMLTVIFFVGTGTGHVAAKKIKEFFVPQKNVTQQVEGEKIENTVSLKERENEYVIYIDEEGYTMEKGVDKDKIVPKVKSEGSIPEVYMEISQVKDKNVSNVTSDVETELKQGFKTIHNEGNVKQPLNGILLWAQSGNKWNDTEVKYYIVDNGRGGAFVIKQQYFVEAAEGHGSRFDNMLKEFRVQ